MACAREIYGNETNSMVLELNGSDDRGINVVREQIKEFSSTGNFIHNRDKLKLVVLDEADSMTYDAQFALRQMIENYANNTRFCFICNYITKIIPGIQSRCVPFSFSPIHDAAHKQHIMSIIAAEHGTSITERCVEEIVKISEGDMRKSINVLQALFLSVQTDNKHLDTNDLYQVIGYPNPTVKHNIIDCILNNDISTAFEGIQSIKQEHNLCVHDILKELVEFVIHSDVSNVKMARIISEFAKIEKYLANNVNEDIQLGGIIGVMKLHSLKTT
jgi:replication factor C subunit 3/5